MDVFEIIFVVITCIAVLELILGIVIFVYKIKKCEIKEIVKTLIKPGSLFIITTFFCYIIYYIYQPLLVKSEMIILIMIGVSLILISRYITISILNWNSKLLSLILAILFGIATFSMFMFLWYLIKQPYDGRYHEGLIVYFYLFCGAIVAMVSTSLVIGEVINKVLVNRKSNKSEI